MKASTENVAPASALVALEKRRTLKARIQSIDMAMLDQEAKLAEANGAKPTTEAIEAKRRALLGAAALGDITRAEKDKRDAQLDAELKARASEVAKADSSIKQIEATIVELRDLRQTTEVALAEAETKCRASTILLLRAEAEGLCVDYVAAALQLKDRFMRLNVINDLLRERQAGSGAITKGGNNHFYVPAFDLAPCEAHAPKSSRSQYQNHQPALMTFARLYQDDATRTPEKTVVRDAEIARLREMGVDV